MERVRRAAHAGSWYTSNVQGCFYLVHLAIITFQNVLLVEPLFTVRPWETCQLIWKMQDLPSSSTLYVCPVNDELQATGKFEIMDLRVDEAEHSMEMHLPYLAKVFHGYPVKIVPILVGALNSENEALYGRLLAKYVDDHKNFFSVSSDFCHWGSRFSYTYYDKKQGPIYKSIQALDHMGMEIIETGDTDAFKQYLQEFNNTICGCHPINVFLHMLKNCSTKINIGFVQFEQSSQCKSMRDSSVSYASAAAKVDSTCS